MTTTAQPSAYKLTVHDVRGHVLGVIIIDDDEQTHRGICNNCDCHYDTHRNVAHVLDWLGSHDHRQSATVLPLTTVERAPAANGVAVSPTVAVARDVDRLGGMTLFHVVCPDDQIRHKLPFIDPADAFDFADQGHACLSVADHRMTRWSRDGLHIRPMRYGSPWEPVDDVLTIIDVSAVS